MSLAAFLFTVNSFATPVVVCPSASAIQKATYEINASNLWEFIIPGFVSQSVLINDADSLGVATFMLHSTTKSYTTDAQITPINSGYLAACMYAPYSSNANSNDPQVIWVSMFSAVGKNDTSHTITHSELVRLMLKK